MVAVLLFVGLLPDICLIEKCASANGFNGGNGSVENPYVISTKAQLCNIGKYPDSNYILARDLVFDDSDYSEGGICSEGWQSVENFTGTFNGCGNKIVNLRGSNGGFVKTNNGTIDSVVFENHSLSGKDTYGSVADINKGLITRCYVNLNITEDIAPVAETSGGVAGKNSGTISYSQITGNLYLKGPQYKYCWVYCGGFAGESYGSITNCYNDAYIYLSSPYITEYVHIGGICGQGDVYNSRTDGSMYIRASMDYDIYASAFGNTNGYESYNCYGTLRCGSSETHKFNRHNTHSLIGCYDSVKIQENEKVLEETFESLDFEEKWMITPNGPVPQGIMDADGNCYTKYSYKAPVCEDDGEITYINQYEELKSESLPAIGHKPNEEGKGCLRDGCAENIITSLTLDKTEVTVYMCETFQLNAKYIPSNATDKTLVWKSSDEKIATVDENGLVTALTPGNVKIEVSAVGGAKAECNITVLKNETEYPESEHNYSADSDDWQEYTHFGKGVLSLTVKFSEQSSLEDYWDYVYVHDAGGNLVKTYTGTEISGAELTVNGNSFSIHLTSDSGGNYYGYSIESVTPNYGDIIPVESMYIGIDYGDDYFIPEWASIGDTIKLSCEVYPENTTSYIVWSSSDTSVATVKGGVLTVKGYGDVTIIAESSDGGCKEEYFISIYGPVYLNADNIELHPGESFKLEQVRSYYPDRYDDYYIWCNSYDESVATISEDGTITAVGPGETEIYFNDMHCYVYVSEPQYSGYIVKGTYTLLVGNEYLLPVSDISDEYLWGYSYDDEIAEYNSDTHTIVAKKEGQTKIYTDYGYLNVRVIEPYVKCVFSVENGIITDYEGDVVNLVIPEEIDGEIITGIGDDAFYYDRKLEKVTMCEGIETIGEYAFASCPKLTEVVIPSTVKTIGYKAFDNLNLTDIIYYGTKEDWICLNIGDYNECLEVLGETYGEIYTAEELYMIADAVNAKKSTQEGKTFKLMNDISLNGKEWIPIGNCQDVNYDFSGKFDGNNHTVSDFEITEESNYNGFFGAVLSGEISNLNIKNATIDLIYEDDTYSWTGILAGWNYSGNIENCSASGTINVSHNGKNECNVGGLVGRLSAGKINNCTAESKIKLDHIGGTEDDIGGLVGYIYGTVTSSSSVSDICYSGNSSHLRIGGVVGFQARDSKKIELCTARGNINVAFEGTNNYIGGIAGINYKELYNNISYMNIVYSSKNNANTGGITGYENGTSTDNKFYGSINRVPYAQFNAIDEDSEEYEYSYSITSPTENNKATILALYSEGKLLDYIMIDSKEKSGSIALTQKPENYKIFVWDENNNLIPEHNALYVEFELN